MTETDPQLTTNLGTLVRWLKRQFPAELFYLLTATLVFCVGGTLYLLRVSTDPYKAIPINPMCVGIMALAWIAALVPATAFIYSLRTRKERRQNSKLLTIGALLEITVFGILTYRTFNYIPRNHKIEEIKYVSETVKGLNNMFPLQMQKELTLRNATYMGGVLMFNYELSGEQSLFTNEKALRLGLQQQTCGYFAEYSKYHAIIAIRHNFVYENKPIFRIIFKEKDCIAEGTASAVPSIIKNEKIQ